MARKNSRLVSIETLYQLDKTSTPLPILFQQICIRYKLENQDRSLAMNLIYGVLRQRQYLDLLISQLCNIPIKKLHPILRQGLAVGLYQIYFLSRIPDSAAVNETVNAIKQTKVPKRLYGFVNGVLRQSIRLKDKLPQPGAPDNDGKPILNHPTWLTSRWLREYGKEEMNAICHVNNQQQSITLRINTSKSSRNSYLTLLAENDIAATPGRYSHDAIILPGYQGGVTQLPGYEDGIFHVQGEAAQLATLLLNPFKKNGRYLDGCAGLGGKTVHLLQHLTPLCAELVAVEPEQHRQEKLIQNLGTPIAEQRFSLFRGNLQEFSKSAPQKFDGILIDAPCSGTGVTGRQPDIRWRRTEKDIMRYAQQQRDLLHLAASLLLPAGVLVYATCSIEPEENKETVDHFLKKHDDFSLADCSPYLPDEAASLVRNGCFQPRPSDFIDGFFAARLVRNITND